MSNIDFTPGGVGCIAWLGICAVCGGKYKLGRGRRFCQDKCRQKYFYNRYKAKHGVLYADRPKERRYKKGQRTRLRGGVAKRKGCYVASVCVDGKQRARNFSIARIGDEGARLAAALQRMTWLIESCVWRPEDGDPFSALSYADSFAGNHEYAEESFSEKCLYA